jgi:UPF0176 protein
MQSQKIVLSFYKYVHIKNPSDVRNEHLEACKLLNLKGRILIGREGINASVCGEKENIEQYKKILKNNELFSEADLKEQITYVPAFRRLVILERKEIVNFGTEVGLSSTGEFLSACELKEALDRNENIVLLDVRND